MKSILLSSTIALISIFYLYNIDNQEFINEEEGNEKENLDLPNEMFYAQRMYPSNKFDIEGYSQAMSEAAAFNADNARTGANWTSEGPFNIGARVTTVTVQPNNSNIIYIGYADGGVWKTTDGGVKWLPIFDKQTFLSISDIEIDPQNFNTIYVATGDRDISGYPSIGDGLYKSTDAGVTWKNIGLGATRIISNVKVDPQNSNNVYAATMGVPFEKNQDRGFYKSKDAGTTWKKTLFVSDSTGVIDMVINPKDPKIIYVSTWDRIRSNKVSTVSGNGARIYKTIDAGETWTQLINGLPAGPQSRIGLAMYEKNPDILYTIVVGEDLNYKGIYKTTNAGAKWDSVATRLTGLPDKFLAGFGWYFGQIRVNPTNPDDIFVLGVDLWRRPNATSEWALATPEWFLYDVHADKHDMVFTNDNKILLATDGGLYQTKDNAISWKDIEDIACTQFYRIEINPNEPGVYYGGAQDNGSTGGNAALKEWPRIYGGDGFQMRFHPTDPNTFFCESQNGNIGLTFDKGQNFFPASDAIDDKERRNWDMPYFLSPHDPLTTYTGTYRVHKANYNPQTKDTPIWEPISGDLTKGNIYGERFHTISTIEESSIVPGLIYVGTSDGNVWRTKNDGATWEKIMNGLPDRYCTKIAPVNGNKVIVSFSGYKYNDFTPHIFESLNQGKTWSSINWGLPNVAINDIAVIDYNTTVIATDAGVYVRHVEDVLNIPWKRLGDNMPNIKVYSVKYDFKNKKVVAGTFARSIMTIDYKAPVATNELSTTDFKIYPTIFANQITIESKEKKLSKVSLYDINGRLILNENENFTSKTLYVNDLQRGIYFLKIENEKGAYLTQKVVKM
jgi:photosystem II stability/assembly factor-like uncharacterized protein